MFTKGFTNFSLFWLHPYFSSPILRCGQEMPSVAASTKIDGIYWQHLPSLLPFAATNKKETTKPLKIRLKICYDR